MRVSEKLFERTFRQEAKGCGRKGSPVSGASTFFKNVEKSFPVWHGQLQPDLREGEKERISPEEKEAGRKTSSTGRASTFEKKLFTPESNALNPAIDPTERGRNGEEGVCRGGVKPDDGSTGREALDCFLFL
ncbi:MAG: hypothetical protein JJT96_05300 [Opitutales bacterium]|nr:hypothetical protein [Opitutales bacterium]